MLGSHRNVPESTLDVSFHDDGMLAYSEDEVYDLLEPSILELPYIVWDIVIDKPSFWMRQIIDTFEISIVLRDKP